MLQRVAHSVKHRKCWHVHEQVNYTTFIACELLIPAYALCEVSLAVMFDWTCMSRLLAAAARFPVCALTIFDF